MVHIRLFRLPVSGRPANVLSDAGQELPDCVAALIHILVNFLYRGILSTFQVVGFCPVGFCPVGFCPDTTTNSSF